ncbi:hypothetical protein PM082_000326 [Marasmius tenuissimus]|nr:hypothetical protein PM082_000326 [Marasmius tenuissimus]
MSHRGRRIIVPARYADFLIPEQTAMSNTPLPPLSLPPSPPNPNSPFCPPSPECQLPLPVPIYRSEPNNAGLFRIHRYFLPQNDPELSTALGENADTEQDSVSSSRGTFGQVLDKGPLPAPELTRNNHTPFSNPTVDRLMKWHCDSDSTKSLNSLDSLVQDVLLQPDFDVKHLHGFCAHAAAATLDKSIAARPDKKLPFQAFKGWIDDTVDISLPRARHKAEESTAPTVTVKGVHHRNLHDVIRAEMEEPYTAQFHLKPYKLFWQPSDNRPIQRVYGEGYTSDRMLQLEAEINTKAKSLPEGSIKHEIGIVCIGLYSDSTLLANFGDVSLWPAYFTFVNWSKYPRLKPGSRGMNHLIYFPSLPVTIQEHYRIHFDHLASDVELRFCKVELLQAIWHLIISEPKFYDAYVNGYIHKCADGIIRHLFYRFFCYSADYVEKVMLACIKYLSTHPCPLEDNDELRLAITKARKAIFKGGSSVGSDKVKDLLDSQSALPIQSAFSKLYQPHGLNHYSLFAPDQFHDNTGQLSDFQKHNVRVLVAAKRKPQVEYLNSRFRFVPTYGDGTIRRFKKEYTKFSRFAGRDYEGALQCAMPCYEGLFPDGLDDLIQDITFTFAAYISYSSLRQHTDSTLATFRTVTKDLGKLLRRYASAVSNIDTRETEQEIRSRLKRNANSGKDPQKKAFSLTNYKTHALGHQVTAVRYWGTADGTNTQAGEREHKRVKKLYTTTNKKQNFEAQIGKQVLREHTLQTRNRIIDEVQSEDMPTYDPSAHHSIARSEKNPRKFSDNLRQDLPDDPVLLNFRLKFRRHLLARILETSPESVNDNELHRVNFVGDRFYRHRKMQLHYTTYDMRRKRETISFRRRPHIMMLNKDPNSSHPYLYARIIGIYHVNVMYLHKDASKRFIKRMDALYVRWFELDKSHEWDWRAKRLPCLSFLPGDDAHAFGFIDPLDVIRSSHLIPAFHYETTSDLLPKDSLARVYEEYHEGEYIPEDVDWVYHYVNMFPDCDMFMRYRGGGVGHAATERFTRRLEKEATENDKPIPVYDSAGDMIGNNDQYDDTDSEEEADIDEEISAFERLFQIQPEDRASSSDSDDGWPDADSDDE